MKKAGLLIILILLAAGTVYSQANLDDDLLSDDCRLPCWNDIIPGETTRTEVLDFVLNSEIIARAEIIEIDNFQNVILSESPRLAVSWGMWSDEPLPYNTIFVVDSIVKHIRLYPDFPIRLDEFLTMFDFPQGFASNYIGVGTVSDNIKHPSSLLLYYPEYGMIAQFTYDSRNDKFFEITPNMILDYIKLHPASSTIEDFAREISFFEPYSEETETLIRAIYTEGFEYGVQFLPSNFTFTTGKLFITPTPQS